MYKSKLQQLCQQNHWPLPKYSFLQDGPDHCPAFKASVLVNNHSFESLSAYKSSKVALNDAAMRAYVHLGSDSNPPPQSEIQCSYKLQLHTYAQKNQLTPPSYSATSVGQPHARLFAACVTVGEQEFKTASFSKTAKEAENAASKIALTCLSPDGLEQVFPDNVKNLLWELARKEGLSLPKYKTSHLGPTQMQLFYSIVEIGGVTFQGKTAKSKKLSEVYAAEVAYRSLEQRKLDRNSLIKPVNSTEAKSHDTKSLENAIEELSVDIKKSALEALDSAKIIKEQLIKYGREPSLIKNHVSANSSKNPLDVKQGKTVELSAVESGGSNHSNCRSYLLNNRVRVHSNISDIELPKGIVMIPIAEDKWVPVSLEFPNEKCT